MNWLSSQSAKCFKIVTPWGVGMHRFGKEMTNCEDSSHLGTFRSSPLLDNDNLSRSQAQLLHGACYICTIKLQG